MKLKLYIIILVLGLQSCSGQKEKINGVSFVASRDSISSYHITPLKKVSANYVSLMPFAFIKNLNNPEVKFNSSRQWFGETTKGVKQYAAELGKQGIRIMLKPQIWVWKG